MNKEIYGLVLVGGESRRMGRDKAMLSYDGKQTQLERTAGLLRAVCPRVFISQRKAQSFPTPEGTEPLYDSLTDVKGPLCGILSAAFAYPEADWLVLACDLPFLQVATLEKLIHSYREAGTGTPLSYQSSGDGMPEPLCAIYPSSYAQQLHEMAGKAEKFCPRRMLISLKAPMIEQDDPRSLDNINTPDEFNAVTQQ
ncbi:MAG: NTP transferase domain-containing protein [Verrucomicrobiota bacterium]